MCALDDGAFKDGVQYGETVRASFKLSVSSCMINPMIKKLYITQILVLLGGVLFSWHAVYVDFMRFYNTEETIFKLLEDEERLFDLKARDNDNDSLIDCEDDNQMLMQDRF